LRAAISIENRRGLHGNKLLSFASPNKVTKKGDLGAPPLFEHVAAQQIVRVAQPPNFIARPKEPEGRYGRDAFSLASFFWRSKRKKLAVGQPPTVLTFEFSNWRASHIPRYGYAYSGRTALW